MQKKVYLYLSFAYEDTFLGLYYSTLYLPLYKIVFNVLYHKKNNYKDWRSWYYYHLSSVCHLDGVVTGTESRWKLCLESLPGDGALGDWLLLYQPPKCSHCKVLEKET